LFFQKSKSFLRTCLWSVTKVKGSVRISVKPQSDAAVNLTFMRHWPKTSKRVPARVIINNIASAATNR